MNKGFTFLEVILYVGLFGFLTMVGFESLRLILRGNEYMLYKDTFKKEFLDFEKELIENFINGNLTLNYNCDDGFLSGKNKVRKNIRCKDIQLTNSGIILILDNGIILDYKFK